MKLDLTNQRFGLLTAREIIGKTNKGNLWRCECTCGGEKVVLASYLRNGHTTSCGCIVKNNIKSAIKKGDRWGRLVAIEFVDYTVSPSGKRKAMWRFRCDCGKEKIMPVSNIKFGRVRSCGCLATEHMANLRKKDITGKQFGRLTAICPTEQKSKSRGDIIWKLQCECGNTLYKSVNELNTGRILSCGCFYKESRKDCIAYRKDIIDNTSLSSIVAAKKLNSLNTSGYTGVYFDKRTQKWQAYINFQKKRYRLGSFKDINNAIRARKEGEAKIHDPVIMEHFSNLTPQKKKEFVEYLKSTYQYNSGSE